MSSHISLDDFAMLRDWLGKTFELGFKLWILGVIMAEIHLCLQDCRTQHDSTHDLMVVIKKSRCNPQMLKCLQRKDVYSLILAQNIQPRN
jgi:hypothetical protein